MKRQLSGVLLATLVLGMVGCGSKTQHFGEPFVGAPEVEIQALLQAPLKYARQTLHVRGKIERQCPAMGCWFFLADEAGNALKVELGDYLPKLPNNLGRMAEVEGEIIQHGTQPLLIGTRVTFYDASPKTQGDDG